MTTFAFTLVLAFVVAWLTAAATSVRSVSRIWLRHWAEQQLAGGAMAELYIERPQRLLLAAGTGIAGTVFAMGAIIGLRERGRDLGQHLVIAALLLLVVGQLVPRAMARRWATPFVPVLMPALRALEWICSPLLRLAAALAPHAPVASTPAEEARESLDDLLRDGELEGVGEAAESAIISGVVEFGAKRASEVMTPRADIVAVERNAAVADVLRVVSQSKYSRIPVFERDLDHVVGLVHSFDVLDDPADPLVALRNVAVSRPDTPCHEVMRRMLRERRHLAIVQGAHGETLGLVTLEDLVEELVGDIRDEHDEPQGPSA